ncbi:MAG TPA: MFS transporter [Myxococcaceae bacterium]|nr:MFS transporter [Myxococcaceae bacterium]
MGSASHALVPPRAALQYRDFRLYVVARFLMAIAIQMQSVAIGWHVYSLTGSALDLGFVGLAQFLPVLGFSLLTGHVADRFDRRAVVSICYAGFGLCSILLFLLSRMQDVRMSAIYAVLVLLGTARAFAGPSIQSLVPHLVPVEHVTNAITWNSTVFQAATIIGPAVGGLAYGWAGGAGPVYATGALITFVALGAILAMHVRTGRLEKRAVSMEQLLAGLRYVWRQKMILGSISLDLFAVLLGGAVALLPIYARDILHTGPWGLGLLRSAPALGAGATALFLAFRPIRRQAGTRMLACVGLFGVATIVFGLSRNLALSVAALAVLGAADMVSVVIRLTLVQIATPPEMRGRVSAVNLVFIGATNELGEFESGITAAWLGTVPAVVVGGVGTLVVVALWYFFFPDLRRIDRLEDAAVKPGPEPSPHAPP